MAVRLDNRANDHRVGTIPTPFTTQHVLADTQVGTMTRPVQDAAMQRWQEEVLESAPFLSGDLLNYMPCCRKKRNRLALFTEGLREFSGGDTKSAALTLLRGVGVTRKEDLLLRLANLRDQVPSVPRCVVR